MNFLSSSAEFLSAKLSEVRKLFEVYIIFIFVSGGSIMRSERCSGALFGIDTRSARLSPGRGADVLTAEVERATWKRLR